MNPLKQRPLLLPAVLAVGLWIAGLVVENRFSDKIPHHPTDAQLLSWIQGNTSSILFGGWLWMLGCLSFLWFAALLRARLAAAEGETTTYSMLAFAGAVAATVFGMLVVAGDIGAAINKDSISAATAGVLHNGGDMFFIGAELTMILFFLGSAVVALRTNALPKWLAVLAILVAVVLVIGPIGWAALIFATPLWLLLTGAVVGRTDRVRRISPTVVTAAIALVALVGVVVPSAVAAPQPRSLTFHLLEKSLTFSYQDNPPYGAPFRKASPGDAFEFSSALLTRDGKRAGTIRAHCVFITGGAGNSAASICDGTFGFAGGTLEAQTTQRGDSAVTRIAIIGGTGAYEGATGSVTSVSSNNGPTRDTFHIVLP